MCWLLGVLILVYVLMGVHVFWFLLCAINVYVLILFCVGVSNVVQITVLLFRFHAYAFEIWCF